MLDGIFPTTTTETCSGKKGITMTLSAPSPDHILETGLGFWASKTLLSAVEILRALSRDKCKISPYDV
jgi:hypothetical protein